MTCNHIFSLLHHDLQSHHFIDNYVIHCSILEAVAASYDPKANDAENILRRMWSIDFIMKLMMCKDFYFKVGEASLLLQTVDMPI